MKASIFNRMVGQGVPVFLWSLALIFQCGAQSTFVSGSHFAYSANTGWVSLRHDQPSPLGGVSVGEYFLSGSAFSANAGWIDFGDGRPADEVRYANDSVNDFGVNHDSAGGLSGFAYGANIGWISFEWASPNDPNRPRMDLITGGFSGYAYSANVGWIALGTGRLTTDTIAYIDQDGDAMADAWEYEHYGSLAPAGVGTDSDGDGQSDAKEYVGGTDPQSASSWLRIVSMIHPSDFMRVTIGFFGASATRLYRIETTTDLTVPFVDCGLGMFTGDSVTLTTRTFLITPGPSRFYRVVAMKPLQ